MTDLSKLTPRPETIAAMKEGDDGREFFTVVFEGDVGAFKTNPLRTDTPFGIPLTVARGDKLAELDMLRDAYDDLVKE